MRRPYVPSPRRPALVAEDRAPVDTPLALPGDTRMIRLTTAAPVRIRDSEWPVAADAHRVEEGYHGAPNERTVWLKIRRHADPLDGRSIVYGGRIGAVTMSGGEIVPRGGDLAGAIARLAQLLAAPAELARELSANYLAWVTRR